MPLEQPQQDCPGIRCMIGKRCIPTKRQCDKYVDCMNAEDELNCDYTGSQYNVNIYRSRNTDHSRLKYIKLKNSEEENTFANATSTTPKVQTTTKQIQLLNATSFLKSSTITRDKDVKVETSTVRIQPENPAGLNNTVLYAIKQLFDNQFTEETFSCRR